MNLLVRSSRPHHSADHHRPNWQISVTKISYIRQSRVERRFWLISFSHSARQFSKSF